MASEQMSRRSEDENAGEEKGVFVGKDRVPKMKSHFESLAKGTSESDRDSKDKSGHEFESLADKVSEEQREKEKEEKERDLDAGDKDRSEKREEPSLEEISKMRGQAQQNSVEAIRAAEERYTSAKQGLSGAADKVREGGNAAAEKAAAAGETGKEAAVGMKDRAVAAGWTAAHYSTEKTVAGTTAVARAVKGVAEKAAEIAVKPIVAARDVAVSAGESVKDYTSRKKEEATTGVEPKQTTSQRQESESDMKEEQYSPKEEAGQKGQSGNSTSMLGAIGETIVEIAQTTKDLVIGEDKTRQQRDDVKHHSGSDQSYE